MNILETIATTKSNTSTPPNDTGRATPEEMQSRRDSLDLFVSAGCKNVRTNPLCFAVEDEGAHRPPAASPAGEATPTLAAAAAQLTKHIGGEDGRREDEGSDETVARGASAADQ